MCQKILFFTTNGCGGSERVTLTISRILYNYNYNIKNIIIELGSNSELEHFIPNEIPYEKIGVKRLRNSFFSIFKIIKKEKPVYVFSSISLINIMLIISSFFIKDLRVIVRHGFMPKSKLDGSRFLIRIFYRFSYKIIAQTELMKNEMINYYQINKELITVFHNPVDKIYIDKKIEESSPFSNADEIRFVAVGRIGQFKDYETMINAFEIVNKENRKANLYILGSVYDKNYSLYLSKIIKEKKLTKSIHFVGFTENPYRYIYNSDCFLLSSISEGLPNVMLEAMYLNIPVVATKCIPFIEQKIFEGVNGYCIPVKDFVQMACAMRNAINLKGRIINKNENYNIESLLSIFR